jgi:heme O synthase-like polyprenyltransferase
MRYHEDYQAAGVPTFPSRYGFKATSKVIAVSSILASLVMTAGAIGVGVTLRHLWALGILSFGLFFLALAVMVRPSEKLNFGLFKYASLYMMSTMLLMFTA